MFKQTHTLTQQRTQTYPNNAHTLTQTTHTHKIHTQTHTHTLTQTTHTLTKTTHTNKILNTKRGCFRNVSLDSDPAEE